jgi:hypothetical protein
MLLIIHSTLNVTQPVKYMEINKQFTIQLCTNSKNRNKNSFVSYNILLQLVILTKTNDIVRFRNELKVSLKKKKIKTVIKSKVMKNKNKSVTKALVTTGMSIKKGLFLEKILN